MEDITEDFLQPEKFASLGRELVWNTAVGVQIPTQGVPIRIRIPTEGASAEPIVPTNSGKDLSFDYLDECWQASATVTKLPPVALEMRILPTSSPEVKISCSWLDEDQVILVSNHMFHTYEGSKQIVSNMLNWLENNLVEFLITDCMEEITLYFDGTEDLGLVKQNFVGGYEANCCEVCLLEKLQDELVILSSCGHSFCTECIAEYCKNHVREGSVQDLVCLYPKCETELPDKLLLRVLSEEEVERWKYFLYVRMQDEYAWCVLCGSASVYDKRGTSMAQCSVCSYRFCTECNKKWNGDHVCDKYFESEMEPNKPVKVGKKPFLPKNVKNMSTRPAPRTVKRKASTRTPVIVNSSLEYIRKKYKKCPGCKYYCEKISGCNMVHCIKCKCSFCWICLEKKKLPNFSYNHNGKCVKKLSAPDKKRSDALVEIEITLEIDFFSIYDIRHCPNCQQPNMKKNRNNHLRCWSCHTNYCFLCGEKIHGVVTRHFVAGNQWDCTQHS